MLIILSAFEDDNNKSKTNNVNENIILTAIHFADEEILADALNLIYWGKKKKLPIFWTLVLSLLQFLTRYSITKTVYLSYLS